MKQVDIRRDYVYTDDKGRYRCVVGFYDGMDGERRVQYEKGFHMLKNGKWHRMGIFNCSKASFAKWAKKELPQAFDPTESAQ